MHLKIIKFAAYYKQENKTISPYLKGGKTSKGKHICRRWAGLEEEERRKAGERER